MKIHHMKLTSAKLWMKNKAVNKKNKSIFSKVGGFELFHEYSHLEEYKTLIYKMKGVSHKYYGQSMI